MSRCGAASPCGHTCTCHVAAYMCVCVFASVYVCARVRAKVISGLKHLLRILRQPTRHIHIIYALKSSIYVM